MEEKYIAAIDMGTANITLTVARINGDDVQILYYKKHKSDGIRNSAVYNPQKATAPIKAAIEEAERDLGIKIMQVVVDLPRCDIRQETATAKVERSNQDEVITKEEVESLKSLAQDDYPLQDPNKDVIYGAIAQSFSDDENFQLIEDDIVGVISRNFEGNFKLFIGKKSSEKTVDKIFNELGIAIAKKYFTPIAQAKSVLTEDEMASGVALVDIGAGATSVTIYQGSILRYYASIPFGGKSITMDIKSECFIAEKLQTLGEKIIQIEGDELEGFKQIPVKYLSEIITARVKEITDAMLYEIQRSGLADKLRGGLVITGGCANLTNIAMYIKDLSGYNVRIGFPRRKFSASGYPTIFDPDASTSIGMILSAKDDGLLSCIDEPIRPKAEEEEEEEDVQETVTVEASDDEPKDEGSLFSQDEVKRTEEKKPEKPKKEKKPKTSFFKVSWDKVKQFVDNMSNEMDENESV